MWTNFHTHSNFCDGKSTFTEHVKKAKELGVAILGFSSHAPLPFDCKWCMNSTELANYLAALDETRHKNPEIEIYTGLEVDFIPGVVGPRTFAQSLDYTIGSIHFVDRYADGKHWEIDGLHTEFLNGLEKIFNNDYKKAFSRYYELTRQMIGTTDCPTVIGHLDKMKIQNPNNLFFNESESWYQYQIKETIAAIQKTNSIVEVNTRGIYQKKTTSTYPSPWILDLIHKAEIPITLNSDAHHCDDLVNQFEATADQLTDIGFKKIHILHHGEWKPFTFNKKGIQF